MNIRYGNMWDHYSEAGLFCITTNSTIKRNGELVMGAGIAREARDRFPDLAAKAGKLITPLSTYGLIIIGKIGLFQTKKHFADNSPLDLIKYSTDKLCEFALAFPDQIIYLNYPGINHGRLTEELVSPVIQCLPDNVTVWKFKK